jgi:1,6-anhydro-N-acetylmuramate kinase
VDRELRAHIEACSACTAHHRRALGLHRALTSGDPAQPTGFETARRRDVLLGGLGAPRSPAT